MPVCYFQFYSAFYRIRINATRLLVRGIALSQLIKESKESHKSIPLPDVGFRFAKTLLMLSLVFLPILAYFDYQNGYHYPALAKGVVVLICALGYFLSRNEDNQQLVRFGVAASLLIMASVGAVYKLDGFAGLIWVPVLPLLFSFLVGTRKGAVYAGIYFFIYAISYFTFESVHQKPPVEFDVWALTVGAYVFVLTVTVLFQNEIQKDETQLKNIAKYDFLTQVFNRCGFVPRLEDEVARTERYGGYLSLIILDVDDFKGVNDKYGHGVGDTLLIGFAALLEQHTRSSDIVARWGGEEFVVLAPNTDLKACVELAEKLRTCIENNRFSPEEQITASFGVVQHRFAESWEDFLNRADDLLLKAKRDGKNRVTVKYSSVEPISSAAVA